MIAAKSASRTFSGSGLAASETWRDSRFIAAQLLATLVSVYKDVDNAHRSVLSHGGLGYALVWLLIEDEVKLAAYKLFDGKGGLLAHFPGRQPLPTAVN
jgi:hypothetical protein